jgi:hypothetical protein
VPIEALLDTNILPATVTHNLEFVSKTHPYGNRLVTMTEENPVRRLLLENRSQKKSDAVYRSLHQIAQSAGRASATSASGAGRRALVSKSMVLKRIGMKRDF